MMHEITMILSGIWSGLRLIAPYWAAGLVLGSLISVYLSQKITGRMLALSSRGLGLWQIGVAAALGILSPLCMFGTVPVIAALGKKGLPGHLLVAFMISSILLNPNLLLMTAVLGTDLAMTRLALCFIAGALAGVLAKALFGGKEIFALERFEAGELNKKKKLLQDLLKAFRITAPYLLLGITLTALLDRYIPPQWIHRLFGANLALGVLFATTLSIPMYACGGGVIPLIHAWLHAGMGRGDAISFMLAGPATKINNLSAVKMVLGRKNFIIYLAYVIAYAALAGIAVELIL
ncbi:MAG: permease [Oscillospiraceae bacterium]|nr:permease [Oscillospiraceae bacterium]